MGGSLYSCKIISDFIYTISTRSKLKMVHINRLAPYETEYDRDESSVACFSGLGENNRDNWGLCVIIDRNEYFVCIEELISVKVISEKNATISTLKIVNIVASGNYVKVIITSIISTTTTKYLTKYNKM